MPTFSKQRLADFAAAKAREARTPKIKKEGKRPGIKAKSAPATKGATSNKNLRVLGTGALRKAGKAMSGRTRQIDEAVRKATR
jgi:hypothetical protein